MRNLLYGPYSLASLVPNTMYYLYPTNSNGEQMHKFPSYSGVYVSHELRDIGSKRKIIDIYLGASANTNGVQTISYLENMMNIYRKKADMNIILSGDTIARPLDNTNLSVAVYKNANNGAIGKIFGNPDIVRYIDGYTGNKYEENTEYFIFT